MKRPSGTAPILVLSLILGTFSAASRAEDPGDAGEPSGSFSGGGYSGGSGAPGGDFNGDGYDDDSGFSVIGNEGDTYGNYNGGGQKRCRPPGVMPTRKPPWPSCDPIKHDAIVAKRAYDRSEKEYEGAKAKVERAEEWLEQVNADPTASRATRDRARDALVRARNDFGQIKEVGEQNAETYKLAEEALKADRGQNLDKNAYDKAVNALEYADIENRYNQQEAARNSKYYDYNQNNNKKALNPGKVPAIGGGGFVGGSNTNAARKNYRRTSAASTRPKGYVTHKERTMAGENADAGWQDGGGNWQEVGDGDRRNRKKQTVQLAKIAGPSFRKGGSGYHRPGNTGGNRALRPEGSFGLVSNDGLASPMSAGKDIAGQPSGALGGSSLAYLREAEALLIQKNFKDAHTSAQYAARLNPANPEAYALDAKALNALGDFAEAETAARKALQQDPNNAAAYQELAWAMLHQGRFDQAAQMASFALRLNDGNAEALMIRAFAYEALGKRDLMMADLERAASLSEKFKPHLQHAKNGGQLFDPTRKDTISLLSSAPAFPMLEGKDPVKMGLFFFSALALGIFAIWQFKRKQSA
jgi:tetratricopeptide (TPR) repeat protein